MKQYMQNYNNKHHNLHITHQSAATMALYLDFVVMWCNDFHLLTLETWRTDDLKKSDGHATKMNTQ